MKTWTVSKISIFGVKAVVLALCFFCLACGGNNNSESADTSPKEFYLEKVDSLRVDRETDVRILDYHPAKKQFLAVDKISGEFLVLDSKGVILEEVLRRGEGPNEINTNVLALSFNQEEGGYLAQSSLEQLWFDDAWEVKERIKFASYSTIYFYSGPQKRVPYYRPNNDSSFYFFTNFFSGVPNGVGAEIASLIEQYNPHSQELEWVLPCDLEQLPVFEIDEKNKDKKPTAVYSLDRKEGRLYLTFERSTEMGVYHMTNDFALIEKSGFKHKSFYPSYNAKNISLIDFGQDIFGLLYYKGLSEAATASRKESDPGNFPFMDPALYQFIFINEGIQRDEEIAFPTGSDPRAEILSLPNSRLLLRDKYTGDVEPDYHTYSIYKLKAR
nr:hypothetical protein [Cytophagales bacterium]